MNTRKIKRKRISNLKNAVDEYEQNSSNEKLERIPVKKRGEIFFVPVEEIASVIADGELLHITTDKNQRYVINFRLKDLEARLDAEKFVRLSRGALANLEMFEKVTPMTNGGFYQITLKNGQEISTSRQQSRILREDFKISQNSKHDSLPFIAHFRPFIKNLLRICPS